MSFFIENKHAKVDQLYKEIRDKPDRKDERDFIEAMWHVFEPYADTKFSKRSQTQFVACAWEMYLAYCLSQNGFELQERRPEAPDVCAVKDGQRYWFEAVVPELGTGPDAVPTMSHRDDARVPAREIELRYANVVNSKANQIQRYFEKGIITSNDIVLIAICSHLLSEEYYFFSLDHYLGKVLYGIGDPYVTHDIKSGEISELNYGRERSLKKSRGATVGKDVFLWTENGILSGVLYCPRLTSHDPGCGREFIIFPNLFPRNPLPDGAFTFCNMGSVIEESHLFSLHFTAANPLYLV